MTLDDGIPTSPISHGSPPILQTVNPGVTVREKPLVHPAVDPPLCEGCQKLDLVFFDPNCPGCQDLLTSNEISIPEVFAILRQWTPQTQQSLEMLVRELLKRGAHVNDRDGLTDMTMLHYAAKAGAAGVGDIDEACRITHLLIAHEADVYIRSRWTNMTALHYATYFDVVTVMKILLKATGAIDVDSPCAAFDRGTPLHIAAANLAVDAARCLVQNGANPHLRDDLQRTPLECVPDSEGLEGKLQESSIKMTKLLQDAQQAHRADSPDVEGAQAKVTLQAYGLKIGDKVMVGGVKTGVLRFCGPTEFASGIWAGIELDEAAGKNDGSVGGVSYFKCSPKHGIFAPVTKISKPGILTNRGGNTPRKALNYANVDTSKVTAKVDTEEGEENEKGLHRARSARSGSSMPTEENLLDAGERVLVAGQRRGVIRFSGEADFAPGWWYGIELDRPVGKNDGSVNGKRYFTCKPKYGVFAPPSRIQRLSDLPDAGECLEAVAERQKRLTGSTGTGSQPALNTSSSKARPGPTRQEGNLETSKIPTTPRRSLPKSSGSAGMRRPPPLSTNTGGEFRLQEGTSVFCNNELGVIRFMGTVEFAEGIWLGVELRTSKGKNDGSVGGTRYFTCKPNHGLLVRPSKVTVRGINGAKLMGNLEATDSPDKKDMSY